MFLKNLYVFVIHVIIFFIVSIDAFVFTTKRKVDEYYFIIVSY